MRRSRLLLLRAAILFLIVFLGAVLSYGLKYSGRIYPNIFVVGIDISGKSVQEAATLLSDQVRTPDVVKLIGQNQSVELKTKDIDLSYDFSASAARAFDFVRTGNLIYDWTNRLKLLTSAKDLGIAIKFDENKLEKFTSIAAGQNSVEPTEPSIKLTNNNVQIYKGSPGIEVDQEELKAEIENNLSKNKVGDIQIPVTKIDNSLSDMGAVLLKSRVEKYRNKKITIKFEYTDFNYSLAEIVKFIDPRGGFNDTEITKEVNKITGKINREPQNPKFSFDNGKVTEFLPALDGIKVNNAQLKTEIVDSLNKLETTNEKTLILETPVIRTPSEVTTDKVNNLGIKELVGRGTSTYFHSIPSRVHNVVLAASRINGTLIKPGDTFSFNDTLGDVSQFTGYEQAYIISGGKTILGDGGGVCQVSSTLFRALLNGGFPIVERAAHAYRVGYYEQNSPPGMDATVYGPSPDLKFTNDTENYVLIEAIADPKHYSLVFELYGTSDGRKATVTKPVVSNIVPALPTVYQDDPTLPIGTTKQIDFSAAGAKVTFDYNVERNGVSIFSKKFISNYRPWAAVYLRGTKPRN